LKVCIIILNYNGWADTIECLESLLRMDYPDFEVVLVENGSADNSPELIRNWAEGKLDHWLSPSNPLRYLTQPPLKKPLKYMHLSAKGFKKFDSPETRKNKPELKIRNKNNFILIRSDENLGFTGGNNVGIRFAMHYNNYDFIWLLNNDTVVAEDALTRLVEKANGDDKIGITGSSLMTYNHPEIFQALGGGIVSPVWGSSRHVLKEKDLVKMNYIVGASFLISKKCILKTGLLSEDFFVYSDDVDYCLNAACHGFRVAAALDSVVFHREGQAASSILKDYYGIRNNLFLNLKYFRKYLPFNFLYICLRILKRIINLHFRGFLAGIRGISDCFRGKMGKQL